MNVLTEFRKVGFNLSLNDENNIVVYPSSGLTDEHRDIIRANKPDIIRELELEKTYLHWHIVTPTDNACLSVIPRATMAEMRTKFPKAIIVEPVETMQ